MGHTICLDPRCDGEVSDMECDCPYAEDGNYCKHMAAVLYELENVRSDENPVVKEDSTDMVNAADEAVVKAFLAEILKNDEKLKQRFLLKVSKPKTSVGAYKKLIDATIYDHEDDRGFIPESGGNAGKRKKSLSGMGAAAEAHGDNRQR